jgi:hypothetical protein
MRLKARKLGYSLNQRGLWAGVIRDPTDVQKKLHNGQFRILLVLINECSRNT